MDKDKNWFVKHRKTHHLDGDFLARSSSYDARNAARNGAPCSHRFKTESGKVASCDDCGTQLLRGKR